jgi:uncharacterized protein
MVDAMTTVVLIHGTYGSPTENWFPWLREQIRDAGHNVKTPSFSTPDGQSLTSWRRQFDEQVGSIGSDCVLVGHSLGALFMCDLLERSQKPIRASFFASGFSSLLGNPEFDVPNATFVRSDFDWKRIRKNGGKMFAYFGDNDPYVPKKASEEFASKLGVHPKVISGGGHLNDSAGFKKFDVLWADLSPLLGRKSSGFFSRK